MLPTSCFPSSAHGRLIYYWLIGVSSSFISFYILQFWFMNRWHERCFGYCDEIPVHGMVFGIARLVWSILHEQCGIWHYVYTQ